MVEVVAKLQSARAQRRDGGRAAGRRRAWLRSAVPRRLQTGPLQTMTSPQVNAVASRIHMACLPRRDAQSPGWLAQNIAYPEIPDIAAVTVPRMNDTTIMTSAETSMYGITWADGVPMTGVRPR